MSDLSQNEVSYTELKKEIAEELSKLRFGFLATSENDHVRNGGVFMVTDGLTIYVFTFLKTRKYKQMKANPNVGFSVSTLQIEGVATLKGHPQDEPEFLKVYKENQPLIYERRSQTYFSRNHPDSRVVEIKPTRICRFKSIEKYKTPPSCFEVLDVTNEKAYSIATMDYLYGRTPYYGA